MTDEQADGFVSNLRRWKRGVPDEFTVGLEYVPAVVRALLRIGLVAEPTGTAGRLRIVDRPDGVSAEDLKEMQRLGTEVLRALRARHATKLSARDLLEINADESDALWAKRYLEIGIVSLRRMGALLQVPVAGT